ncbi:MAG TPA: dihydrofolate reductase [Blastocatellia bacterium]
MILSLIVAMDEQRGIGYQGHLPWKLSADLKRFKQLTMGHHIIVGRKTFESIGRPLPGRQMIVITRNPAYRAEGAILVHSVESAIAVAHGRHEDEAFICGGSEVYSETIRFADRIYLTEVHARVDSDTFFPEFNPDEWVLEESSEHPADDKNEYPASFKKLSRASGGSKNSGAAAELPVSLVGDSSRGKS